MKFLRQPLPGEFKTSLKRSIKMMGLRSVLSEAIRRELFRAKIAGAYYFGKRVPQKHCFILCAPRTGSTLLTSYLNCHPAVFFETELLSQTHPKGLRSRWTSKSAAFNHLRHVLNYLDHPICGAKLMFPHFQMRGISLSELQNEFPKAQWLVLYRRNILDQYLSHKIAWNTALWTQRRGTNRPSLENIRVRLNAKHALEYRDWVLSSYQETLDTEGICKRSIWISYEDLVADSQKLLNGVIFPFLGVNPCQTRTSLTKQNIWNYPELISNYEEIKDWIQRTDFTQDYPGIPAIADAKTEVSRD